MIETSLLSTLINLLVVGLILYVVYWIVAQLNLPHPAMLIAKVIIAIIAIVYLLRLIGVVI